MDPMTEDNDPTTNDGLADQFKANYRDAKRHQHEWQKKTKENYELVAGRQLTEEEEAELEDMVKPYVTFNRIDPVVSAITGHQINNRQELKYLPRTQGDAEPNEILSGAAKYVDDESDSLMEISDAFWDLVVTGMGWTETHLEFDEDPEGKIWGADRISPREMGWDPAAVKRNLADARFVFRERWIPAREAKKRWPKLKSISLPVDGNGWLSDIDEIVDDPRDDYGSRDAGSWYKEGTDQMLICQYQYYELEPIVVIGDPLSNRTMELTDAQFKRYKKRLEQMGVRNVRQMRRKYYQCYFAGDNLLEKTDCPCPTSFTLRAMTGKRDEVKNYWYGYVDAMKDPQKWSNKVFSDITSIMYKNRTGGAFVEEGALVDPRKAEDQWAEEAPLIILRDGAISKGKVMERNPIQYPAGLDRLMEFAVQAIPQVTGISMELMGLVDRNQPGVLEMQRKRAGMTILATIFDSLKRYGKERGRVLKYFIDEYISDGRLVRIVGGDGIERYVPLVREEEVSKYDIIVDEAPNSPNQKEETFLVLRELVPQLAQLGITPPAEMIDYLPLPAMLIQAWKEQIEQAKNDPMTKRMQELNIAEREAAVEKDKANAGKFDAEALLKRVQAVIEQQTAPLKARMEQVEQLSKVIERSKLT